MLKRQGDKMGLPDAYRDFPFLKEEPMKKRFNEEQIIRILNQGEQTYNVREAA